MNSIRETNGNFDSCNSCKRLIHSSLHELHESKFPYRIYPFETFEFLCSCIRDHCFNPAVAGVFRHPRLAGGGGFKRPHVITRERMAAERRATRRSKALDETILKHSLNFTNEVTCQVKVRSKVKIGAFRLRAVETSKLSVCGQNLL